MQYFTVLQTNICISFACSSILQCHLTFLSMLRKVELSDSSLFTPPIYIGWQAYSTNNYGPKSLGPFHNTKPTKKYTTNPPLIVQL
jgi:hypothetical protein